jgi:fibro-slime domain-containing protein
LSLRSFSVVAFALSLAPLALSAACSAGGSSSPTSSHLGAGGSGSGTNNGTAGGLILVQAGAPPISPGGTGAGGDTCGQVLPVTFRDFKGSDQPGGHQDFEASGRGIKNSDGTLFKGWNDIGCGLVQTALGTDNKPIAYTAMPDTVNGTQVPLGVGKQRRIVAGAGCYPATSGVCNVGTCQPWDITPPTFSIKDGSTFAQWYNTTPNVNMEIPGELMLTETPAGSGISVYDSTAFFPIDGQGFGNTPGQSHNYSFTTEIHVKFTYQSKQVFTFRGDDDLWIFVNGKLALDVGGQHQALQGTIDFDAQASKLGITPGSSYAMDIFHAERQTTDSNFHIETNIRCFDPVVVK